MSDARLKLILGSPGCGKTTRLLEIVEREMEAGVPPDRIAFVTFTKAAAEEAKERASLKFNLDPEKDLPWFRTIHSMSYKMLGVTRDEVMGPRDWKTFSNLVGEHISGHFSVEEPITSNRDGDMMLRVVDYAATTMQSLEDAWHELDEPVEWFRLKRFQAALLTYKGDVSKLDFTDMLLNYNSSGEPLNIEVGVVDEAQDLTRAQWEAVQRAFSRAKRIYVGGDDDQAIYRWAGADVDYFLNLTTEPEVLQRSHRLPAPVFRLGQSIARRISRRYTKHSHPSDHDGSVHFHRQPDGVDLSGEGTWLLLGRNNYLLKDLREMVRAYGVNYQTRDGPAIDPTDVIVMKLWERIRKGKVESLNAAEVRTICKALDRKPPQLKELQSYAPGEFGWPLGAPWFEALEGIDVTRRDYYVNCLARGTRLTDPPRIRIETIHGVKGAEADNVLLLTDMSSKTQKGYYRHPDHEHRVFYVGITRARRNLHVILPQTVQSYPIG